MFDWVWDDTMSRIRSQKLSELTVSSHLKSVQGYTFRGLTSYDHAMTFSEGARRGEVSGVVWREIYDRDQSLPVDFVERIGDYVVRNDEALKNTELDVVYDGGYAWGDMPGYEGVRNDDGTGYVGPDEGEIERRSVERVEKEGGTLVDDG